ncbi:MAG: MMPL family transporter [Treponema sp.]|jgi:predicted RND superfamily exporter protein|nr:MMPL family transporter [Treponema sp.]
MERLFKRPGLVLAVIAGITLFFAAQLPKAELDNNNMRFLPKENPARLAADHLEAAFGGQTMILVGLERPYGDVFEPEFLARLRDYAKEVETVEFVGDVNSLMSTQYITADDESILVEDLVPENFSGAPEEIAELKRRIASWDTLRGSIVSEDFSATQIIINLDVSTEESTSPEVTVSLVKIRDRAREMFQGLARVYVTGQPVINATINESVMGDNALLFPLTLVVVLAVLFFSFRRLTFVMLPLITVVAAVVWTIGAMALFGVKLSILTTLLPVILVAVGSAYGIHVITHYIGDGGEGMLSVEEHRGLIFTLMGKLIKPVALAALTTLAGFASFCFTPVVPMREFGYCSCFGVAACFLIAVTMIPSLLLVRGPRAAKPRRGIPGGGAETGEDFSGAVIGGGFLAAARKKTLVLACTVLLLALSLYGLSKIIVDNVLIEYFQHETDISRSDRFIREYFGGSKDLTLAVEADTTEELLDPAVLTAIDRLSVYLTERVPLAGKVTGFTDIIKRINQVFNADEGPEGIRARNGGAAAAGPEGFGFGETDFGRPEAEGGFGGSELGAFGFGDAEDAGDAAFGNFGFGDAEEPGPRTGAEEEAAAPEDPYSLDRYSAADLIALLDAAAGASAEMSGGALVRELKRLVNYDGFSYYEIPADPARYGKRRPEELQRLVSNYLVLLAGGGESGLSNDPLEPTAIKTMIQLRATGNREILEVIDQINAYVEANFPKNVRVVIGGGATQEAAVTALIVNSQIISIAVSVLTVFLIIALSYRSLAAGCIAAAPLSIAILCNFAAMGFLGIKLNIATALIASLAVGIGIDYTIHFIESFKREYQSDHRGGDDFLRRTFNGCGKAVIINALSVGAGFGVLAFSRFRILAEFGGLIALSMGITALVSLIVIPVLLTVIKPRFIYKER